MKGLSIVGLGHLGLPLALHCASKGYKVVGVDKNPDVLRAIKFMKPLIYEPEVDRLLRECKGRFTTTDNYMVAIDMSDITFILVPTPSEEGGGFSTSYVEVVAEALAKELKRQRKPEFHVVVVVSTVMPGTMETVIKPILEKVSGKKCGVDFGLCYNPEFVALGSVIRDLANPDAILIGESDSQSGYLLAKVYKEICDNNPPIVRTNFYNAEVAKLALNVFVTTRISLVNTLAEICERVPGGDVDAVTKFLGMDSRIGPKYLVGGLGYGGPCFPRDNLAFNALAKELDTQGLLQMATHDVNQYHNLEVVKKVMRILDEVKDNKVAILGLTYKPNTNVIEEASPIVITKMLLNMGCDVRVYEPSGSTISYGVLGDEVLYAKSPVEALRGAVLCILATPWEEFKTLTPQDFIDNMVEPRLLDCWRFFNREDFVRKMEYYAIGVNSG